MTKNFPSREQAYNRLMLRSSFQSLFWAVILDRKTRYKLKLKDLASALGVDKSYVSRSFSSPPNWQIDKIADMAGALGLELELIARDQVTGERFTPTGKLEFATTETDEESPPQLSISGAAPVSNEMPCVVVQA